MTKKHAPARFCLEVSPAPCVLVLFGGTGDLARRKLIPSLFQLHTRDLLHATSRIVGCGRTRHDDASFRDLVAQALPADAAPAARDTFLARVTYVQTDEADPTSFKRLAQHLTHLDALETPAPFNRLYYLAIPPTSYQPIIARLAEAGLLREPAHETGGRHLLLEKPFGSDSASAAALDAFLQRHVNEDQLFRIDHYLGKDTVQNILILRFANILFEPVWNAAHIDHVQITVAETLGVEHRAGYYEQSGHLRDMFQNHLLEMLALVAMEPPAEFSADAIHREKLALIRAIRAFPREALESSIVRGQYAAGGGLPAYREEPGVNPESTVETFAAAKFRIDTPRWHGVPFYLRSGKRLAARTSTITLVFKPSPQTLFGACDPDALVLRVQPDEGMSLNLQAKRPGPKLCMGELPLSFNYADLGDELDAPDAYARLLLDAMLHDHTLFVRNETIAAAWRLFTPVLETWRDHAERCPLHPYPAGSEGPEAADALLARDGRAWRPLD
jgi:glucose-6-phosphate 1-dehydrogenase